LVSSHSHDLTGHFQLAGARLREVVATITRTSVRAMRSISSLDFMLVSSRGD